MKKVLLIFIASFVLISLCACEKDNNDKSKDTVYIESLDEIPESSNNYTLSNEYVTDLNSDKVDDRIALYTDAEITEDGFSKNDGNNWKLMVFDGNDSKVYELFSDYVQLGNVYFQVADYFKEGKPIPTITFYESTGAVLKIFNFVYEENKGFLKETIYDSSKRSDNGINLKYSSIPIY